MPERVFYFTDSNAAGGAERVLVDLLAGLDRTRWQPLLIHHREPGLEAVLQQVRGLDVQLHELPRTVSQHSGSRWLHLARLVGFLQAERPAVFHAHLTWPLACKYGLLAAALSRVPAIIATEHCHFDMPWRNGVYLQQLVSFGVHRYIGVSRTVADGLRRSLHLPPHKVQIVHNGTTLRSDTCEPSLALRSELTAGAVHRPIIMCVARLHRAKGHRFLLRAMADIPDAVLVMVGDGPEQDVLEAEARALGIAGRTLFLGHRTDVADLLASCDIFVLPSLNEGLPLSVLEAMAAGRPVIATHVGGTSEVVAEGETGLLVQPADSTALANALRTVLNNPDLAQRMGVAGRARVRQEFTVESMVKANTTIYKDVLKARRGAHGRR